MKRLQTAPTAALVAGLLMTGAVHADCSAKDVQPYRPSVSTPAQLSAAECFELELGGLRTTGPDHDSSRITVPYTLKYAFSDKVGIRVGGDAWVRQAGSGETDSGSGDTSVVLKYRFGEQDSPAFGVELGEKLPSAGSTRGSGHADTTVNGIFSADLTENWHTDLNLSETRLGVPSGQSTAWQTGWAASLSYGFPSSKWGLGGELSGTRQDGTPDTAQFLAAASWKASKTTSYDFGVARGLTGASSHNQVFAGVTLQL